MAKIICVRCDTHDGIVEKWTVYFNDGKDETYEGETPPFAVSRFCIKAKYGYKSVDGVDVTDWWMNDYRIKDRYC